MSDCVKENESVREKKNQNFFLKNNVNMKICGAHQKSKRFRLYIYIYICIYIFIYWLL